MTALTKLNTLISAGVERGLTQTAIASLLDISPRTLGRLRDGATIDATREAKIDSVLRDLRVEAPVRNTRVKADTVKVEPTPLNAVDALNRVLDLAPRVNSTKTNVASILGTSRRTLDRWADGIHPIPKDVEVEIFEVLSDFEVEIANQLATTQGPAETLVVVEEEPVAVAPVEDRPAITFATIYLKNSGMGVSTLGRGFSDVDSRLAVLSGLDECDFVLNKSNLGNIKLEYIKDTDTRIADYYRRAESFARGSGKAYVVLKDGERFLLENVTSDEIDLVRIGIQVGSGAVTVGEQDFEIEDIAYIILSPELGG